ncbi:hypothetical protein B484DRAFT_153615 [Ochromonadaceae sp. CCMP2298]|nr:hypothetical protein B484DRAFT_153615 [Ochromonadaceae sp. CCMP2298]|mmetsp:Transcript_5719/g.12588  ORF Transcript_5719/g.12588 Transcript_5719/m.12588 type:complete len:173 (+) Transcript_5719:1662-2180(+)
MLAYRYLVLSFFLVVQCEAVASQWRSKFARVAVYTSLSFGSVHVQLANAAGAPLQSTLLTAVSKTDFLDAAKTGVSIDMRNKDVSEGREKSADAKIAKEAVSGVRLVDLGGNRGARGLASDGLQGGSLAEQLKAYGGPGVVKREDTSLKNPFKQQQGGVADQLKVYETLQGK